MYTFFMHLYHIYFLFSDIILNEALSGVLGNGEQGNLFRGWGGGGTREQKCKNEEIREQRQFWGTENVENQDFDFGEQGKMPIYFRGTREHAPPLPGGPP